MSSFWPTELAITPIEELRRYGEAWLAAEAVKDYAGAHQATWDLRRAFDVPTMLRYLDEIDRLRADVAALAFGRDEYKGQLGLAESTIRCLRAENLALQRELAEKFGAAADVIKKREN